MVSKAHIERLYSERVSNELWCQSQVDVANFADGCLFGRFFNELLQNTDDAEGSEIECILQEKKLVVYHNGRHFSETDVEKIVSFAQQKYRDKSNNASMTGYKGIGFKALLSIASMVHILSNEYSFRFDKDHWKGRLMPWQMIPIWTDPGQDQIDKVTFIFHLNDPQDVLRQFEEFFGQSRPILFLRNVNVIKFTHYNQTRIVTRKDLLTGERTITEGKKIQSEWIVRTKSLKLPIEVHDAIQDLNTTLCPDRLKNAATIELTFAFSFKQLSSKEELEIFATLPTKVHLGLPYVVNTEFLVEAQREHLVKGVWNNYLFTSIGFFQFFFLQEFAKGDNWQKILHILGPNTIIGVEKDLCSAYEKGFVQGYKEYTFIPSFSNPGRLLKLHECRIDSTGFYFQFKNVLPPDLIPPNLVHPELEDLKKLEKIVHRIAPKNMMKEVDILNILETLFKQKPDPVLCFCILDFFRIYYPNSCSQLKEKVFILTEQGSLGKISDLHLTLKTTSPTPPHFIEIPIIHPDVLANDEGEKIKQWLQIKRVTGTTIVTAVLKWIKKGRVSLEESLVLVRYLFKLYDEKYINGSDLEKLRSMPIITRANTLSPAEKLYFPKEYNPTQDPDLEELFSEKAELFVHSSYMEDLSLINRWWQFFLHLGVQEKCDLCSPATITVEELKKRSIFLLDKFLQYLHTSPEPIIGRSALLQDTYRNFVFFSMMENLSLKTFSLYFWQILNGLGRKFMQIDNCQFIDGRNTRLLAQYKKSSYIKFVLNNHPCIRGCDGKLHVANQLYSPAFRSLQIKELIAAEIDVEVNEELLDYLGFKTKITPGECYDWLAKMRLDKIDKLDFYVVLLKNLIEGWKNLDEKERQILLKKQWYFLAHNNEWHPANQLVCFGVKGSTPRLQSSQWFKNVPGLTEKLAAIFNRPIITSNVNESEIKIKEEDTEVRALLLSRFPLIALQQAVYSIQPPHVVLQALATRLKDLKIFIAAHIPSIEGLPLDQALIGNRLYFTERCQKYQKFERIGEYFGFDEGSMHEIKEILSLKTGKRTEDDWIIEKEIDLQLLQQLQSLLNSLDNTPSLELGHGGQSFHSFDADQKSKSYNRSVLVPDQKSLCQDLRPDFSDEHSAERIGIVKQGDKGGPKIGIISSIESLDEIEPLIPIEDVIPSKGGIQKLAIQKKNIKLELQPTLKSTKKSSKAQKQPSGQVKKDIGRWGESFAFQELVRHYEQKYGHRAMKIAPESYQLHVDGIIDIAIKWLNCQEESGKSYDIELMKHKNNQTPYIRPIEVKASGNGKVHFFLSEGEWKMLKLDPKNRLYLVLHAGTGQARTLKIPNPSKWLENDDVIVKEHKKYEISASKID